MREGRGVGMREGRGVGMREGRGVGMREGRGVGIGEGSGVGASVGGDTGAFVGDDTGFGSSTIMLALAAMGAKAEGDLDGRCVGRERERDAPAGSAASVYVA